MHNMESQEKRKDTNDVQASSQKADKLAEEMMDDDSEPKKVEEQPAKPKEEPKSVFEQQMDSNPYSGDQKPADEPQATLTDQDIE